MAAFAEDQQFLLLGTFRYQRSQYDSFSAESEQSIARNIDDSLYDLIISDSQSKIKVQLDPRLNYLVETGQLIPMQTLFRIERVEMRFDEPNIPATPYYSLTQLTDIEHCPPPASNEIDWEKLPLADANQSRFPIYQPVSNHRACYLPLGNDIDYPDPTVIDWKRMFRWPEPLIIPASLPLNYPTMMECIRQNRPIVARIVRKSSVHYYGRADGGGAGGERFPYSIELELCDSSRRDLSCIIWNYTALKYFPPLRCDQMIVVRKYRVKERYLSGGQDIELSVNSGTKGENPVRILHERALDGWEKEDVKRRFPRIQHRFVMNQVHQRFAGKPDTIEVIGRVDYAGPVCTEVVLDETGRPGLAGRRKRYQYRWILLSDISRPLPRLAKIYSCAQPETFQSITAGCLMHTLVKIIGSLPPNPNNSQDGGGQVTTATSASASVSVAVDHDDDLQYEPYATTVSLSELKVWHPGIIGQAVSQRKLGLVPDRPQEPSPSRDYYCVPFMPCQQSLQVFMQQFPSCPVIPFRQLVDRDWLDRIPLFHPQLYLVQAKAGEQRANEHNRHQAAAAFISLDGQQRVDDLIVVDAVNLYTLQTTADWQQNYNIEQGKQYALAIQALRKSPGVGGVKLYLVQAFDLH